MSTDRLRYWQRAAARRRLAIVLAGSLPLAAALTALVVRLGDPVPALLVGTGLGLFIVLLAVHAWQASNLAWLTRRLDALSPALEDSSSLLLRDPAGLQTIEALQRRRLEARLENLDLDPRPPWPRWPLASLIVATLLVALPLSGPQRADGPSPAPGTRSHDSDATSAHARIHVQPPAHTGLPAREVQGFEAHVPEGSTLTWALELAPVPDGATLEFHDGSVLALTQRAGTWQGERRIEAETLYRLRIAGGPPADEALHRIQVDPDAPPRIRVLEPERSLSEATEGQTRWKLVAEVEDDYGLGAAWLQLDLAQGPGENVQFSQQQVGVTREPLPADVPGVRERLVADLDLAAFGLEQGDDLVARFVVQDNRAPAPQETRSAGYILRWPLPSSAEGEGVEVAVQRSFPAFFRSQRQVILDTEALLADADTLAPERLLARSDAIGVDQKLLRLRYGEFLGEEDSGHDDHGDEPAGVFGSTPDVLHEFGHSHDIPEAATLLDPESRETLREALGAMWQAELHLRLGEPAAALPHEHRALERIKAVQQASRIYLARSGLETTPLDESRRLGGEREGAADRATALTAAAPVAGEAAALWQALDAGDLPDFEAVSSWAAGLEPPALDLIAALDAWRRDPACTSCRETLRAALWPHLPQAAAGVAARPAGHTGYIQALDEAGRR